MTLRTRNRIYLIFLIISVLNLLATTGVFLYAVITNDVSFDDEYVRTFTLFSGKGLFSYSFASVITGIFLFSAYACVTSIVIIKGFMKTQSIEVIYFLGFLVGCLTETSRILLPLFDLWKSLSTLLVVVGCTVLAGRVLCTLSLLFAALFSENDQRQNVERNLIILLVVSVVIGIIFPLDTNETTSTFMVLWGYKNGFLLMRVLAFVATLSVLLVNCLEHRDSESLLVLIGCALLFAGHALLCVSDCFVEVAFATLILVSGTFLYLGGIHKQYMWH